MVSPTKLKVHSGKEEPISQSVSVSHLKTRKFWKQFAPLWKVWAWKLKVLFPERDDTGTFIVPAPDVRAQVLSIKERRNCVRSKYSNLFHMETDSCLLLLLLICVFLVFQMECCNRSSLKPEWPMCDGRPFASPLFCRLAGRGPFFSGFPFRWALQLTVSLARCLTYTMSCLSFTALSLHQSQSALLQEIQPARDINLICYKTLPTKSVTCLQVGPLPLSGRRLYLQDPTNRALHLPMKIYLTNNEETLSLLLHIYVGGAMLFNHLKYNKVV